VFQDVAIEAGVQLFLSDRQDVVEDVLPGLRVEGRPEVGAVVALDHHLRLPVAPFLCGSGRSPNLGHDVIQTETVSKVILSDGLGHVRLRLENLLRWLCVLLGRLRLRDFLLL